MNILKKFCTLARVKKNMFSIVSVSVLLLAGIVLVVFRLHTAALHSDRDKKIDVVTEATKDARREDISKTPDYQIAARDSLLSKLIPNDPNSIFTVVDAIQANPSLSHDCHERAHDIGHAAYDMYGFAGAMNFTDAARLHHASVQDICAGGYVHGVLEVAALDQPDFQNNPGILCANTTKNKHEVCFHGLGHALMLLNHRDVGVSLTGCRVAGTKDEISRCFEGVWMELFWGTAKLSSTGTLGWDKEKPVDSCRATENDAKPTCYLYVPLAYFKTHPKDYAGAVTLCTTSDISADETAYCLKGVGLTLVSHFSKVGMENTEVYVASLTNTQKTAFYTGLLEYASLSGMSDTTLKVTCDNFKTDGDICRAILNL